MIFRDMAAGRRLPLVEKQLNILGELQDWVLMLMMAQDDMDSGDLRRISETVTSMTGSLNALLGVQALVPEGKEDGCRSSSCRTPGRLNRQACEPKVPASRLLDLLTTGPVVLFGLGHLFGVRLRPSRRRKALCRNK